MPEHHDRKRQDEVRGAVGDVILLPDGVGPRARQHAQLDGEDQNEQQRQPEFRNAARDGAELADRAVEKRSLPLRAEHPEQQRERENEHKADAAEKECVARAARDDLARGHFVLIRDAEIPAQGILRPADILREDRLVEAELFLRLRALLQRQLLCTVTVVGDERVARGQARDIEHRERQDEDAQKKRQHLFAEIQDFRWLFHCAPPSRKTKCSGSTSTSSPVSGNCPGEKSGNTRFLSIRGSGTGIAASSALV